MQLETTIMRRGPASFTQLGQFLGYPLKTIDQQISPGLAQRLARYAVQRMTEAGFEALISASNVEVYTVDGDEPPASRQYVVKFKSGKGGYIEVVGILTQRGWPTLDHGFEVGTD